MQVSVAATGGLERSITVDVPEERILGAVEERLKSMSRTSQVQGFRPGKAPMRIIKQRFGAQVRSEVVEKLVNSSFYEAITQESLKPVGQPLIDPLREAVGAGLSYTATFEVLPEIELKPVTDLHIEQPTCEITEADVDAMIEKLRRQRPDFRQVARAAATGDRVNFDYQAVVDDEGQEDLKGEDIAVTLGDDRYLPGLEQGLQGATAGQSLELRLTFPEDFDSIRLSGQAVTMQIRVNHVEEAVLPELNDEFFTNFGVSEGGEPAFRQEVRRHMDTQITAALRNRVRDSVMQALHDAHDIEVPNTLVRAEAQRMLALMTGDMETRGLSEEDAARLADSQDLQAMARRQVALQLLTAELIRANNLQAKPEKIREHIEARAQAYQDPSALINRYYNDKERFAQMEALALEDELIDWVAEHSKVKKLSLSFDELVNKGQNPT
ncbi:MAG: trigger factor [Gammaproteobacteria bacterium]|nr:trigger factor [Gammaproteobacteria bacterium]MCY4282622.1 trigger factor [Gammaproteobacteria bacterium]MCY4339392.1 trigger factor [Gammaproteobacteria bacterium]